MSDLIDNALVFAANAHAQQTRKYTGEPYICHPICVAAILKGHGFSDNVIAAALLHDVVEDTLITNREIIEWFGEEVGALVAAVTDISKPQDGNRAIRKEIDRRHIASGTLESKAIKLADLIDNTRSIVQHDKGFAKIYLKEKALLLKVMDDAHPVLLDLARRVLVEALAQIEENL